MSELKEYKVLVAVDFSPCSEHALKSSRLIMGRKPDHICVLETASHNRQKDLFMAWEKSFAGLNIKSPNLNLKVCTRTFQFTN